MTARERRDGDNAPMSLGDRPEINPLFVFRWEEPEQAYLLLYPEGIIKLNDSAGSILTHCTGEKPQIRRRSFFAAHASHTALSSSSLPHTDLW